MPQKSHIRKHPEHVAMCLEMVKADPHTPTTRMAKAMGLADYSIISAFSKGAPDWVKFKQTLIDAGWKGHRPDVNIREHYRRRRAIIRDCRIRIWEIEGDGMPFCAFYGSFIHMERIPQEDGTNKWFCRWCDNGECPEMQEEDPI